MIESHLKKMRLRSTISPEEESAIRASISEVRNLRADTTVVRHGRRMEESILLISGWMARSKQMENGQRQISEIHLPGDFPDLHSFSLKRLDHEVFTLTPCRVAVVPHDRLRAMMERLPHLMRVYWFATNLDAAIQREWTVSLGRRSAMERMAHLFCELLARLSVIGMAEHGSYDFPLTQVELGECLGLTAVHVNRTLQELRRRGLIELAARRLTILDVEMLQSMAGFDPTYLYLEPLGF